MTITNRIYYGWWLVGTAVVCQFTFLSVGQVVVGVLMRPVIDEMGWQVWQFTLGASMGAAGDALAGIIAGMLAQGMSPWPAARLGCHILRRAGAAAAEEHGPGMLASDVPVHISKQLMLLLNEIG